jgi:hypothetical protein
MGKRAAFVGLALVLVVLVCLAVWRAPLLVLRSLASLHKVDGYPLYVMHYYGDYGFSRLLEQGTAQTSALGPQEGDPWACTGFAGATASGGAIVGRSFDWRNQQALLLFTHPPGAYAAVSMVDTSYLGFPREDPAWADRTVLLQAPYLPFDGMNERGLAVSMMAVPHARDGPKPGDVTLDDLQAIRLLLD